MTDLLTTKEAARHLGCSYRTLERWRIEGGGPTYIRVHGRCVRYRLEDLQLWISARAFTHTAAESAGA